MTEFTDEELEFMEWTGADSVEEASAIWEAQSAAQEGIEVDKVAAEIEADVRPNKKDIAHLLRNYRRADIPQVMREYIAKLLLGEKLGGKQRRSRLGSDEYPGLMKYSSEEKLDFRQNVGYMFGTLGLYKPLYDALLSMGIRKESSKKNPVGALDLVAKAELLGIISDFSRITYISDETEKNKIIEKFVSTTEKAWDEVDDIELTDKLDQEINKISRIVYPRKK